MAHAAALYTLDLTALSLKAERIRARIGSQVVNGKNRLLFIYPDTGPEFEPHYVRYGCGIVFRLADGTVAKIRGQLVITGERIIGLITDGSAGKVKLDESSGSVYGFTLDLDDLQPPSIKTNWRNKPVEVFILPRQDREPAFLLEVFSVVALMRDNGRAGPTELPNLLHRLTPEGRRELQTPLA
jgi:hypothetical protein